MATYVPNFFAGAGAPAAQALRSYTPNPMSGTNTAQQITSMAPHLSVAAADRPFAADIALLQGSPEYANKVPQNLDAMWRQSPHTYQSQVADMLRQPGAAGALQTLKTPPPEPNYLRDEDGNIRYQQDDDGNWYPRVHRGDSD